MDEIDKFKRIGFIGIISIIVMLLIMVITILVPVIGIVNDTKMFISDTRKEIKNEIMTDLVLNEMDESIEFKFNDGEMQDGLKTLIIRMIELNQFDEDSIDAILEAIEAKKGD